MFSSAFFQFIIVLGLAWTGAGALALIVLLVRDWKKNQLW
jgi:hypothetical protein